MQHFAWLKADWEWWKGRGPSGCVKDYRTSRFFGPLLLFRATNRGYSTVTCSRGKLPLADKLLSDSLRVLLTKVA